MKILLAVSGGIDSMYMAGKAPELYPGAVFAVAHCNFGLRGEESDADEAFVRDWAGKQGLEFFSVRFETLRYADENSLSVEMAARELRYRWFASVLAEKGFDAVAVAHNACDNAETFFLNLIRGTGTKGLRGMEKDTVIEGARVLRPLLEVSREEIHEWMCGNGKAWREDRTNAETLYRRNRIRHDVMPVLKDLNPSVLRTLARDMENIREADDVASGWWNGVRGSVAKEKDGGLELDIAALRALPYPEYALACALAPYGFSQSGTAAMKGLVRSGKPFSGKRFLSAGWKAEATSDKIIIEPLSAGGQELQEVIVSGPGEYTVGGKTLLVESLPRRELKDVRTPEGVTATDGTALAFPFVIRKWEEGDWMRPTGLRGKKKLSDMFVDLKWGFDKKRTALVAAKAGSEGRVAALVGKRTDEDFRITEKTETIILITVQQ